MATPKSDPIGRFVLIAAIVGALMLITDWRPNFSSFGKTLGPARTMPSAK